MSLNLLAFLLLFVATPILRAATDPTEKSITARLNNLPDVPDAQRRAALVQLAVDIRTLPAGKSKVALADHLSHDATEGDAGKATLDAVAQTLFLALVEAPQPIEKGDVLPEPYLQIARLVKYEHVHISKDPNRALDPKIVTAFKLLAEQNAELQTIDFTLKDLRGKNIKLSDLRGKMVLVNFWATWCLPCRVEMPELESLQNKYADQGLVILSITDEAMFKVGPYAESKGFKHTVLLDFNGDVHKLYNIDTRDLSRKPDLLYTTVKAGIPQSFIYDREGKLIAQALDWRTEDQFVAMLQQAGLKP